MWAGLIVVTRLASHFTRASPKLKNQNKLRHSDQTQPLKGATKARGYQLSNTENGRQDG